MTREMVIKMEKLSKEVDELNEKFQDVVELGKTKGLTDRDESMLEAIMAIISHLIFEEGEEDYDYKKM
jgi:hypothetical protein